LFAEAFNRLLQQNPPEAAVHPTVPIFAVR
jgi:hypothetical protein